MTIVFYSYFHYHLAIAHFTLTTCRMVIRMCNFFPPKTIFYIVRMRMSKLNCIEKANEVPCTHFLVQNRVHETKQYCNTHHSYEITTCRKDPQQKSWKTASSAQKNVY